VRPDGRRRRLRPTGRLFFPPGDPDPDDSGVVMIVVDVLSDQDGDADRRPLAHSRDHSR